MDDVVVVAGHRLCEPLPRCVLIVAPAAMASRISFSPALRMADRDDDAVFRHMLDDRERALRFPAQSSSAGYSPRPRPGTPRTPRWLRGRTCSPRVRPSRAVVRTRSRGPQRGSSTSTRRWGDRGERLRQVAQRAANVFVRAGDHRGEKARHARGPLFLDRARYFFERGVGRVVINARKTIDLNVDQPRRDPGVGRGVGRLFDEPDAAMLFVDSNRGRGQRRESSVYHGGSYQFVISGKGDE